MKKPFKKINQNYSTIITKKNNIQKINNNPKSQRNLINISNIGSVSICSNVNKTNNNNEINFLDDISNVSRIRSTNNYSKYINVKSSNSKISSLQQARIENKMKIERSVTPSKMDKAESFINEYLKTRQNETVFSNNNKNKIDSALNSLTI